MVMCLCPVLSCCNSTGTCHLYTLSLHDALPIFGVSVKLTSIDIKIAIAVVMPNEKKNRHRDRDLEDRKSTRLNSSHLGISYAVFCLKKKRMLSRAHCSRREELLIFFTRFTQRQK